MDGIAQRLDRLRAKLQNDDFLQGKGLGNEVNISIFCYDPRDEMAVRRFVSRIANDASVAANCRLIERNICDDEGITDEIAGVEAEDGREYMLENLQRTADNKAFAARMQYPDHKQGDVLLVTGVGEVYPFLRVHSLLEAIQPEFSDIPVVVLYPGKFDGRSLRLFNRFEPNSYYRAFNII